VYRDVAERNGYGVTFEEFIEQEKSFTQNDVEKIKKAVEKLDNFFDITVPGQWVPADSSLWDSIARDRKIKNQFETGRSRGGTNLEIRTSWEYRIAKENVKNNTKELEIKEQNVPYNIRPKYGIRVKNNFKEAYEGPARSQYGDILIKYNDDVAKRTTYTLGNSSGEVPAFVEDSKYFAFRDIKYGHDVERVIDSVNSVLDYSYKYCEMQIWGEVDVDRDIMEIIVPKKEQYDKIYDKIVRRFPNIPVKRGEVK